MVSRRNRRANYIPLIIEPHPEGYDGYPFITLIQYRDKHNLTIVDNADDKTISAYVLDLCSPVGIDEELVISLATEWYDNKEAHYPLSIDFSRKGISGKMAKINRNFTIDYVTRVIGPLPKFNMTEIKSIRRRKKKPVPRGIEVKKFINF